MSITDQLLVNARRYAEEFDLGDQPRAPRRKVAIVTCMDARVDPHRLFGLVEGDAHLIRNAGGVVTDDEIRALAISQRLMGTAEIILIKHTDCGMINFSSGEFEDAIEADTGFRPHWDAELAERPRRRRAPLDRAGHQEPFIPHRDSVRGFVYDVSNGTTSRDPHRLASVLFRKLNYFRRIGDVMSVTDELLQNAKTYEASFDKGDLPMPPGRKVAIVACMDARLNAYGLLGLKEGDAHVIRNAGGVITDDEIRSLAISQRLLGTEEIILIHHTDCGMLTFTDDEFKASILEDTGIKPEWAAEAFSDLDLDVRQSLNGSSRARSSRRRTPCAGSSTRSRRASSARSPPSTAGAARPAQRGCVAPSLHRSHRALIRAERPRREDAAHHQQHQQEPGLLGHHRPVRVRQHRRAAGRDGPVDRVARRR